MASLGSRKRSNSPFRYLALALAVAALYAASGRLGLLLANTQQNATLIWPPTGLALAAMVSFGPRLWPGVLIGAAITNAWVGTAPGPLVGIAVGNTLEALVGWYLLCRVAKVDMGFARLRDVLAFLLFGVLLATVVSATIGVGSLLLFGAIEGSDVGTVWLIWWLGDAGGAAVVAPLLLVAARGRPSWLSLLRRPEAWAAIATLGLIAGLAFGVTLEPWSTLLLALLAFPTVVWIGLRLGPRGAVTGSFVAGAIAVIGTARGSGPFVTVPVDSNLYLLWAYVFSLGTVAMILAAAVAEAVRSERARAIGETEHRRMLIRLQHSERLESLARLAGGVAHDFNNILAVIRCNAELLRSGRSFDDARRDAMLEDIEHSSDRAAELCAQLLAYAGRSHRPNGRLNMNALVQEMNPLLRAAEAEAVLELAIDSVPPIRGDRTQLGQVLMNLVLNATQAAPHGTVSVSVTSDRFDRAQLDRAAVGSELEPGHYVVLEVRDDGEGMSPETREHCFEPFFTTRAGARGLGLASAQGIVRAHGGAILVDSVLSEGTAVRVLFPAIESVKASPSSAPQSGMGLRVKRILLAEDNDDLRWAAKTVLEGAGFEVLEADDGTEALRLFQEHGDTIDALVFDVSMPRMSGTDALVQIHALAPELPAVLMSGYDAGRLRQLPEIPFVAKPFTAEELLDALRAAIHQRSTLRRATGTDRAR